MLRFIDEANGHLQTVKEGAFSLSSGENVDAQIGEMFRAAHTLKGGARMLKLQSIADVTHQLEEILSELRDKKLQPDQNLGTLILQATDDISRQLDQLTASEGTNNLPRRTHNYASVWRVPAVAKWATNRCRQKSYRRKNPLWRSIWQKADSNKPVRCASNSKSSMT
ncbi:Hpt domain-containing protein [Buttiauxella agrestis]